MNRLKLDRVRFVNRDPIGARRITIESQKLQTPNHLATTPLRGLSSTESNHRENLLTSIPFDEPFENHIFELVSNFNPASLAALRSKNGAFARRLLISRAHCRRYSEMITKFYPRMTGVERLDILDIRALVDLQLQSGFDVITIPETRVDGNINEFDRNLTRFSDYVADRGAEPMPYVDMRNDNALFRLKLRKVASHTPNIRCLGLTYRSFSNFYPNFSAVGEEIGKEDLWIHQSNIPRMHSQTVPLAEMHLPQTYSIDSTTLESRPVMAPLSVKPLLRVRKFVEKTLGEVKLQDIRNGTEPDSDCKCPVCAGVSNIRNLRDIDIAEKVHETFSSTKEFENSRESIRHDDMKSYIQSRKYLSQSLSFAPVRTTKMTDF